jgi:hypothetical protein
LPFGLSRRWRLIASRFDPLRGVQQVQHLFCGLAASKSDYHVVEAVEAAQ